MSNHTHTAFINRVWNMLLRRKWDLIVEVSTYEASEKLLRAQLEIAHDRIQELEDLIDEEKYNRLSPQEYVNVN